MAEDLPGAVCSFSETEKEESACRHSQGRSESVGRFPSLLVHGTIGGVREAQGEGLEILLTSVEGTDVLCVYFSKLLMLACGFASHGIV